MSEMIHKTILTNGVNLHVAMAGDKDGPLVILLHGFPEYWEAWKHQIPALAEAGYSVWAPDQRGYNLSDKPKGIKSYGLDTLALDIIGLIDVAGVEKAHVIGHDFGANVAWRIAQLHPERLEKLAILNVPHPMAFREFIKWHPSQWLRSWYVPASLMPVLPEWTFGRIGIWVLRRIGKAFKTADMSGYKKSYEQPGALKGMINWYRAYILGIGASRIKDPVVHAPTLIMWGEDDIALDKRLGPLSLEYTSQGKLISFSDASHFVQHDEPEKVNEHLLKWLTPQK